MKVTIKSFDVEMEVKNNGIEFEVRKPDGTFLGDCIVSKTEVIWMPGKTKKENGKRVKWEKFIEWMSEQ